MITQAFVEVRPEVEKIKEAAQATALETIKASGIDIVELDDAQRVAFRDVMYGPSRDAYLAGAGDAGAAIVAVYESEYARIMGE